MVYKCFLLFSVIQVYISYNPGIFPIFNNHSVNKESSIVTEHSYVGDGTLSDGKTS